MTTQFWATIVVGLFLSGSSASTFAGERKVYVLNAIEGDVIEVVRDGKQYRVHIAGIDAPPNGTALAKTSKQALGALTFGRWALADCVNAPAPPPKKPGDKPQLGPLYCRVDVEGADLAASQLEAGNVKYSPKQVFGLAESSRKRYQDAESKAKEAKVGVWAQ